MEDYLAIIEKNFDEEVAFLQKLVRCPSEQAPAARGADGAIYPFGQGVQEALELTLAEGERMGFVPLNVDNYGGHLDFAGSAGTDEKGEALPAEKTLGVLGHLDVVPAGDGWSFPAYSGEVAEGFMYGRGTTDDKGPTVAALFAMKALKEAGYVPAANIRLVLGLDEETGWSGMRRYLEKVPACDYGFTPDEAFPVVNGEMGILTFDLVRKMNDRPMKGLALNKLEGGAAPNMVPAKARAIVNSKEKGAYEKIKEKLTTFRNCFTEVNGLKPKIGCKGVGTSLEISVEGKASHGAHPELGLNAISVLMQFLGELNFVNEDVNDFISFYNDHIGFDCGGERLGCDLADEESGHLILNAGVLRYDRKSATLTVNLRYPVTATEEQVFSGIMEITDKYDLGIVKKISHDPIWFAEEDPLVRTCVKVYQDFTGDLESRPIVTGTGTYARAMKNHIAFGALFPGDPDLMHQRDERLELKQLLTATKIYAKALHEMTLPGFSLER